MTFRVKISRDKSIVFVRLPQKRWIICVCDLGLDFCLCGVYTLYHKEYRSFWLPEKMGVIACIFIKIFIFISSSAACSD